ncbi:MAG: hypothetical protein DID89_2727546633 [Candidatus Nitrotoga sp. CP45]|nr:MAG: hypothetical protein DID89_2727546633 [Candidatus Nitrotoga sp. CP45]
MSHLEILTTHLFRLVHFARSVEMKRALTAIEPEPTLNFWRLIHGNQLDIAVLEWCKVFGSDGEGTHWKNIVRIAEHNQFRQDLLVWLGITADEWGAYWKEMKGYRDNLVAHHIEMNRVSNYPVLDNALKSSFFYYKYLIKELRLLGETEYPDDLETYCAAFQKQAREIASQALASTAAMKEDVG